MTLDLSRENNQNYTSLSVLGAYVYPDHVSISIFAQYMVKQRLYCRYFDCKRREIAGSAWHGIVFPESVIHCPRRAGAEFVSVSRRLADESPAPVRLTFRVFEKPVHELSACVAPLYGNEPKWLQIAEFIEHHKLEGVSYFYFHIGNVTDYDRRILDHYESQGEIEVKVIEDKYERPFYAWQLLEIQDCHLRSKFHSKWTAFIDIDERISTSGRPFLDLLRVVDNGNYAEIQLPLVNVIKSGDSPREYAGAKRVGTELLAAKYVRAQEPTWIASKALIRPDKIGIMSIHYAIARDPGYETLKISSSQAVLRHMKATQHRINQTDWHMNPLVDGTILKFSDRPMDAEFVAKLTKNVVKRVQRVYEKVPANCTTIPRIMWESRWFPDPCEKMLLTW
ncbi:unnamed protein product [Caenorhabditis sp. 36 PRJEB53466]|nr:unnamed protein product [Caenorhabditis sp. 36 PRJEB53466]